MLLEPISTDFFGSFFKTSLRISKYFVTLIADYSGTSLFKFIQYTDRVVEHVNYMMLTIYNSAKILNSLVIVFDRKTNPELGYHENSEYKVR